MKKTAFFGLTALFALLAFAPNASAAAFADYAEIFMTTGKNVYTPTTVFAWDQKPFLYIKFKDNDKININDHLTESFWTWENPNPADPDENYYKDFASNKNNVWISFTDARWEKIRKEGDWIAAASSLLETNNGDKAFYGATTFHINAVPEPVSTVLFLTGGAAMAGTVLRRRLA